MKFKHTLSWFFIVLSACWLLMWTQSTQAAPELTIGNYQLVSSKRITRTVFEYTYKAGITNSGPNAVGVLAILSVNARGVTVLDGRLDFGDIQSGVSASSKDTFTIRQDRLFSFNVNALIWNIQASNLSFSTLPDPEKVVVDPNGGIYPVNQLLVNLIDEATRDDTEEIANNVGGKIIGYFPSPNMYQLEVPAVTITQLRALITTLELDPRVESAFTNNSVEFDAVDSDIAKLKEVMKDIDPMITIAYDNIKVIDAWDEIQKNNAQLSPITIGIVDTGVDTSHPEFLHVNLDTDGIDSDPGFDRSSCTIDNVETSSHGSSHGTQVAGIIGANNIIATSPYNFPQMNGILSGNPDLQYSMIIRPLNPVTYCATEIMQMEKVINAGAKIVNASLGQTHCEGVRAHNNASKCTSCIESTEFDGLKNAYEQLFNKHKDTVLFVASAGNGYIKDDGNREGLDADYHLPGGGVSADNLITVGAAMTTDPANKTTFSNYGANVDIAAPGENVYAPGIFVDPFAALGRDDYQITVAEENGEVKVHDYFSGTSASAPMVTGVAGLIKAIKPKLFPIEIKKILVEQGIDPFIPTATPIGPHLDALAAVCHPSVLNCKPLSSFQFTDSNLAQCVSDSSANEDWQYVEQVTTLSCAGKTIASLSGIENFKYLKTLDLTGNAITDLSPLTGLTQLEQLNLSGNTGLRCVELEGLAAALSSTVITRPADCVQQNSNFVWPVTKPQRTQGYSILNNDFNKYHAGFDLISSSGDSTVYAAAAGKVRTIPNGTFKTKNAEGIVVKENNHDMGNVIIIDHNNGQGPFTLYAHLDSISITNGAEVKAGDSIGIMGNTGCEPCGVHLHFEVKQWRVMDNLDD